MKSPHVKKITFAVAFLSVGLLASCDHTVNKIQADNTQSALYGQAQQGAVQTAPAPAPAPQKEADNAVVKKHPAAAPSTTSPSMPHVQAVSTPPQPISPQVKSAVMSAQQDSRLVWHQIKNYNAADPSLPADGGASTSAVAPSASPPSSPPVVQYNRSVDVYPVEGDLHPYRLLNDISGEYSGGIDSAYSASVSYNNARVDQVYFPYASARVAAMDRHNLRKLVRSLTRQTDSYSLTVVGHASSAVNGVKDPLRKRIINFRMAQKRADAVVHVLTAAGARPDWVEAKSVGAMHPAKDLHGLSQQAADQRADVFLNSN